MPQILFTLCLTIFKMKEKFLVHMDLITTFLFSLLRILNVILND